MTSAAAPAATAAPSGEPDRSELVAAAVLAVPGVVALHPGPLGEVATFLPGRKVAGVRLADPADPARTGEVHVVVDADVPVRSTAAAVHAALALLVPGPWHVVVGDVVTGGERAALRPPPGAPAA